MEKKKKKLKKWQIALLVFLCVLLLLFLLLVWFYYSKLNLLQYDNNSDISIDTTVSLDDGDINIGDTSGVSNIDVPDGEIYKNENVFNILLLGTDERTSYFSDNARADTIMLVSIDKKYHTVKLVSFERGLGVKVPGRNDDWLTHTFRYGGANLTMQTVREMFCVDVDRYVRINFGTFEKIIDAVGGVDISLSAEEIAMLNKRPIQGKLTPGVNHLNGNDALLYCRLRQIDSDWVRVKRQRNTIQAVINQTKSLDIFEVNSLLDQTLPLVKTNLTQGEITGLVLEIPSLMGVQTEQQTIPAAGTFWGITGVDGRSMFACDYVENRRLLRELLYKPYLSSGGNPSESE